MAEKEVISKDFLLFLILGAIIGFLVAFSFFNKKPIEITSIQWRERTIIDSVPDTVPFYITTPNETIYIDSTTKLLDLPIRSFSKLYNVPVDVNKTEAKIPIQVSAKYRGLLYSIDVATDEGYQMQIISSCKPDWKWYGICFLGGLVTAKIID